MLHLNNILFLSIKAESELPQAIHSWVINISTFTLNENKYIELFQAMV